MEITQYRLGRIRNHDARSLQHPAVTGATHNPVKHRTLGAVLDQGNLGSCVANASAHALNTAPTHKKGQRIMKEPDAVSWYGPATAIDPFPGTYPPDDTGTDINSLAKVLRDAGLIVSWEHAFGLDHVLAALQIKPICLGIDWHESMFTPDKDGFVHPDGNVVGGHETLIREDHPDSKYVLVRNSWGKSWGLNGHYKLTYDDLGTLLKAGGDAASFTI